MEYDEEEKRRGDVRRQRPKKLARKMQIEIEKKKVEKPTKESRLQRTSRRTTT